MGSGAGKLAREAKQETTGALARVKALELFKDQIVNATRNAFGQIDQRVSGHDDVLEALINLAGKKEVEDEVKRLVIERGEAKAATEKATLDAAIKAGQCVPATEISEKSVVVGSEVDADGNPLYPSRVQFLFPTIHAAFQEKMKGAKVGDVITTPPGTKFTVNEIYDVVTGTPVPAVETAPVDETEAPKVIPESEPLSEEVEKQLVEELVAELAAVESPPANE